jgi:phosphoenolpyruvate phosphomutase
MTTKEKVVYLSMSTDVIHGGHITIIEKARKLGQVVI